MSRRYTSLAGWLIPLGIASNLLAQQAPPEARPAKPSAPVAMRPPLFFSETWRRLAGPPDDHNAWPAAQDGVSNPNLELKLYGPSGKEIQLVAARGQSDLVT